MLPVFACHWSYRPHFASNPDDPQRKTTWESMIVLDPAPMSPDNKSCMAAFRSHAVAELASQLRFTPYDKRVSQLAAAEEFLYAIDPCRNYPLDFVTERITGYRPKSPAIDLIHGRNLQHDIGLLMEDVSQTLAACAADAAEPVLMIDELASQLNIASKTLQRWRRRGLPARYFIFPDGKQRIGFFLSSVERFMRVHANEPADSAPARGRTREMTREALLHNARRLAAQGCWVEEIGRRLSGRFGCSQLAILSHLRSDDLAGASHRGAADLAPPGPEEAVRVRVLRAIRHGVPLRRVAHRTGLSRYGVYRIIMDRRLTRLVARNVRFIDDSLYHQADAADAIRAIASQNVIAAPVDPEAQRIPRDLPPYLQELYRTPLLSPQQERATFIEYNYRKFCFAAARRQLDPILGHHRNLTQVERLAAQAAEVRNRLIAANLRLVVSVARKHLRSPLSLMDLVSEGNITLMRAVESFDTHRGHRFSTYATFALMRGFARQIPQMLCQVGTLGLERSQIAAITDPAAQRTQEILETRETVASLLKQLEPRERDVLAGCFGLGAQPGPQTCQEIGQRLGISRQRVRQIQQTAMEKLRSFEGGGL